MSDELNKYGVCASKKVSVCMFHLTSDSMHVHRSAFRFALCHFLQTILLMLLPEFDFLFVIYLMQQVNDVDDGEGWRRAKSVYAESNRSRAIGREREREFRLLLRFLWRRFNHQHFIAAKYCLVLIVGLLFRSFSSSSSYSSLSVGSWWQQLRTKGITCSKTTHNTTSIKKIVTKRK